MIDYSHDSIENIITRLREQSPFQIIRGSPVVLSFSDCKVSWRMTGSLQVVNNDDHHNNRPSCQPRLRCPQPTPNVPTTSKPYVVARTRTDSLPVTKALGLLLLFSICPCASHSIHQLLFIARLLCRTTLYKRRLRLRPAAATGASSPSQLDTGCRPKTKEQKKRKEQKCRIHFLTRKRSVFTQLHRRTYPVDLCFADLAGFSLVRSA